MLFPPSRPESWLRGGVSPQEAVARVENHPAVEAKEVGTNDDGTCEKALPH